MEINTKKSFSKLLGLALVVSILGAIVAVKVYAAQVDLTTTITNSAPTWAANPSDGSSYLTTPTNVGAAVTFTGTATDANGNGYWLAVCKTGGTITPSGTGAAPVCTAGNWCISSSASATGVANTCSYTALQTDPMSNNWEAYACDNNASGSTCSSAYTGTEPTGSPFHVNHPPVIGTVAIGPSYGSTSSVDPGNGTTGVVYFRVGVTDPDSEGTQDTIDMYACDSASTFDATTLCSGTTYCSVTGVATGTNADCNNTTLAPIPTTHGSKSVKIFLRDNSSTKLKDAGTSNTQSYSVTDVAPTASAFSFTSGYNPLNPSAGASVNQAYTATITDNNGYADVTTASGAIYVSPGTLTGAGACTTASELNCYNATSCPLTGGSGATVTATCGGAGNLITTWFNIAPSASWKAHLNAVSDLGTTSMATEGTFTVSALAAVGTAESSINYGSLATGGTSAAMTTTIQNAGNVIADALVDGDLMCTDYATCAGSTIARAQQHWSPTSSWTWGSSDYALIENASVGTETAGCSNRSIAVTTNHSTYTTSPLYWKIQIPSVQATGSYTGRNYFIGTANDCTGTN